MTVKLKFYFWLMIMNISNMLVNVMQRIYIKSRKNYAFYWESIRY